MTVTPPATHNITASTDSPIIQVSQGGGIPIIIASTVGAQGPAGATNNAGFDPEKFIFAEIVTGITGNTYNLANTPIIGVNGKPKLLLLKNNAAFEYTTDYTIIGQGVTTVVALIPEDIIYHFYIKA